MCRLLLKVGRGISFSNKEAKTVARNLVDHVFCRLGTPVALLTDNAGEVDGHLMQEICQLLDIDKQRTSFYRPETNSFAEQFHATLNSTMGRMVSKHQKEWDLLLPHLMAAYRASEHQSTGYSPNYLMFGREVRAPVDIVFGIPEEPSASYDDYTSTLESRMREAYSLVRKHLGVAAERMKRQYDLRVRPHKFQRGQWVLYFNPRKFQRKQQKWQRKFSPYLVIKVLPPVNYLIQKSKWSRPVVAHMDKLKEWHTDNPPRSWLTDVQSVGGNGDHVERADGDLVADTVDTRNAGQRDDVGVVEPHADISGHGVVGAADSEIDNVAVDGRSGGGSVVVEPLNVNMGNGTASGDSGRACWWAFRQLRWATHLMAVTKSRPSWAPAPVFGVVLIRLQSTTGSAGVSTGILALLATTCTGLRWSSAI